MTQRMTIARDMEDMVGKYYSREWFRANILHQSEEEVEQEDKQMAQEMEDEGGGEDEGGYGEEKEIEDEGGEEGEDEGGYGEEKQIDLENDSSIQLTDISDYRKKNFG